jgi:polyphosphate kinase
MLLIVRRESRRLKRYVHLGTGNYHTGTSRVYTDIGFLTADPVVGEDVHQLFVQLTGLGQVRPTRRVLQAPFTLRDALCGLIEAETQHARAGRRARIVAKMNSLSDPGVIRALYEASQAGVEIDLVVRGLCCLRPGVPGVSERIRVRSIVGRFLEHSRIFYFHAGGRDLVYCSSADWMQRNLFRRVEACFPIEDPELAAHLREVLAVYLADNVQAWECQPDGSYARLAPGSQAPLRAQEKLLERHAEALGQPAPAGGDGRVLRMPEGEHKRPGKKAPRRAL